MHLSPDGQPLSDFGYGGQPAGAGPAHRWGAPFAAGMETSCNAAQLINDKKVTDHHAVIPTRNLQGADLSGLPVGEKAVLELVALRLLCAVAEPHTYAETAVTVECAGAEFTAKGRTVKIMAGGHWMLPTVLG